MAQITITIPDDKIEEVKAAFAEEGVGQSGEIPVGYTINTWAKHCLENYIRTVVLTKRRKDAVISALETISTYEVIGQ